MDKKQFELVRDFMRSCNSSSLDHDYSLELIEHVEQTDDRLARLEAALRSIANSTCCGSCKEASLVAKAALSRSTAKGETT